MSCIYCHSVGPFTDEHVLARAFAGPGENWMLVNLVCSTCNKLFSTYERAWTCAPGLAEARIFWGPQGRKRQGVAYQVHPSEHAFFVSSSDPVSYEVDILPGFQPRFRPQFVLTANGLLLRASDMSDVKRFQKALTLFLNKREITVQKRRSNSFRIAIFSLQDDFHVERIELRSKPVGAWLDGFPLVPGVASDPRVSVDARGNLRIRATSMKQAGGLMAALIAQGNVTSSEGTILAGDYQVAVRSRYEPEKVFRAVAKTVVNYAVDTFGPAWMAAHEFRPILDYCLRRIGDPPGAPFVGVLDSQSGIRAIDDLQPDCHALALACGRGRVIGLVRLYGGTVWRVHLGPAPTGTTPFTRSLLIDYNGKGRVPPFG